MADAKWFQVPGVMTSKGKRFYAAVRIVDNGGMLNLNTAFKFDPNDPDYSNVDGSSLRQVNALAMVNETYLQDARANNGANAAAAKDLVAYEKDVIWQYLDVKNLPGGFPSPYTPFDISDELELRYRYLLDQAQTRTRVELCGPFGGRSVPVYRDLDTWYPEVVGGKGYDHRHIATTYNMDRILTPRPVALEDGTKRTKMVNVNTTDEFTLRSAVTAALLDANPAADPQTIAETAAQITANLRDYVDDDDQVTVIAGLSSPYLGFEQPCVYISEVACNQVRVQGTVHSSYAIELYRPYFEDKDPNTDEWKLVIDNPSTTTDIEVSFTWSGSRRFHVILAEDAQAKLSDKYLTFTDGEEPVDTMPRYAYNRGDYKGVPQNLDPSWFKIESGAVISLRRSIVGVPNPPYLDFVRVLDGWMKVDDGPRSLQRDISPHKCVRRLWSPVTLVLTPGLGNASGQYVDVNQPQTIQAHPANKTLTNIGELGRIFRRNAYGIQPEWQEKDVLVDVNDPNYARLFNYLTVMDPAQHTARADETRIMGRININTAPAFVLAQLPWMSYQGLPATAPSAAAATQAVKMQQASAAYDPNLALARGQEIVANRRSQGGPYRSTGDLMRVSSLHYPLMTDRVGNGINDIPRGPDLTPDTALDDFEERDLIFTRISDLITVRSDVFTAYVLVRIGETGPQRRIIAVLDRSGVTAAGGKVRILAHHPVPDPR